MEDGGVLAILSLVVGALLVFIFFPMFAVFLLFVFAVLFMCNCLG